jgi:hypothetical protein
LPGFESLNWNGIVGPPRMPREIVSASRDMLRALNS